MPSAAAGSWDRAGVAPGSPGGQPKVRAPRDLALTAEEQSWVSAARARGGIRIAVAVREGAFTYAGSPDKSVGLHADLGRSLGAFTGLPVTFVPVGFDQFFTKDGTIPDRVKTDPSCSYQPDIFSKADLLVFDLSPLPWRMKIMNFLPVFPNRAVLVTPRGKEIRQLSDLYHRRIEVITNTSRELFIDRLQRNLGIPFSVVRVPFGTDLFDTVRKGKADALVRDGNWVMLSLQKNPDFNVTLSMMPTEQLSWAVSKKNPVFGRTAEKFLAQVHADGEFDDSWERTYGISYPSYLHLIGEDPVPVRTAAEEAVLETLKKTGLRAAVHQAESVYEPQADGSVRGIAYNLLLEISNRLEVPLRIRTTGFSEFFAKDGRFPEQVKTDPGFTYKPDIFGQTDLLVGNFTPLDWRKKFLAFVNLYPSKLVWLVRKSGGVRGPGPGIKVVVQADTGYADWLKSKNLVRPEDLILTRRENETIPMVVDGQADATLTDALLALAQLPEYPTVTIYPADSSVEHLSRAVSKDNGVLADLLVKTIGELKRNGTFDILWQNYYKISLVEYLGLLALDKGESP